MTDGNINAVLRALALDPHSADLTLNAAVLYARHGDAPHAAEMYLRFQALAPNSPLAHPK